MCEIPRGPSWIQIDSAISALSSKISVFILTGIPILATVALIVSEYIKIDLRVPIGVAVIYFGQIALAIGFAVAKIGYPYELRNAKDYLECLCANFSKKHDQIFLLIERNFQHEERVREHLKRKLGAGQQDELKMHETALHMLTDVMTPRMNAEVVASLDSEIQEFTHNKFEDINYSRILARYVVGVCLVIFVLTHIFIVINGIVRVIQAV